VKAIGSLQKPKADRASSIEPEASFRKIIALCDELWQPEISAVIKYRAQFIEWLIEKGKLEDASTLQVQKLALMHRIDAVT
jgi:hypothetical protein